MRVFLILVAFLAFHSHIARAEEMPADVAAIVKGFPPELMFESKPVDPDCVRDLLETPSGEPHPQDLTTCGPKAARKPEDPAPANGLVQGDNDDIGYDYNCTGVDCGSFFYRYVGHAEGGMAIATEYTDRKGRVFTGLDILKRDGDKLNSIGHMTNGERCDGGLSGPPKVTDDGHLLYGYNVTPYGFVSRYATDKKERVTTAEITDCSSCCFGRFAMDGRFMQSFEFQTDKKRLDAMKRDGLQGCFNLAYLKVQGKTVSDEEAKAFVTATLKQCREFIWYQQYGKH